MRQDASQHPPDRGEQLRLHLGRPVHQQRLPLPRAAQPRLAHGGDHPAQAEAVVAVHVGDKHGAHGGRVQLGTAQLVARALPAIHQKDVLVKAHCNG
jgi:hypothetical protein